MHADGVDTTDLIARAQAGDHNAFRDLVHRGKHVTRQQTQGDPVRVMQNDRVIDRQAKC